MLSFWQNKGPVARCSGCPGGAVGQLQLPLCFHSAQAPSIIATTDRGQWNSSNSHGPRLAPFLVCRREVSVNVPWHLPLRLGLHLRGLIFHPALPSLVLMAWPLKASPWRKGVFSLWSLSSFRRHAIHILVSIIVPGRPTYGGASSSFFLCYENWLFSSGALIKNLPCVPMRTYCVGFFLLLPSLPFCLLKETASTHCCFVSCL